MNIFCLIGLHKWGAWRDSGKRKTEETWYNDGSDGYGIIYDGPYFSEAPILEHTCERCGIEGAQT